MASLSSSLRLRVRPHYGQAAVLRSAAFCTAAIAGTGGGKTVGGMIWLLEHMVQRPGEMWVVAEPTRDMVQRILLTSSPGRMSLVGLLKKFDPDQVFLRSRGILRHRLGTVFFTSADRPESMQGAHVAGVWLDEAGLMKVEAFLVALQRVGYAGGRLLITTTPYNMGWLKRMVWDRWKDGDKDYSVSQFPSTANPRYDREAVERARRVMSPARFRMMYYGEFGHPEGMIYDCFDALKHVVAPFEVPPSWERFGGQDYGFNHPTVALFVARSPEGVYYVVGEHWRREATLDTHAGLIKAAGGQAHVWYGDPAGKQQMAELRRQGLDVVPGDNDVLAGIDTVYELIASGRLKVFNTCHYLLDELEGYVWDRSGDGFKDKPLKERDDAPDALRYVLHSVEKGERLQLHI